MFPIREKRFDYVEVGRFSKIAKRAGNFAKNTAKRASGFTVAKNAKKIFAKIKGKKK